MKVKFSTYFFLFLSIFLLLFPTISYCQSVSINSTYRFTPDGDAIVFRIRVLANADETAIDSVQTKLASSGYSQPLVFSQNTITKIFVGEYSDLSSAKASLDLLQQSGFSDAFITETTLSSKELLQKGIPVTPSIYQQDINNASNSGLSDSALWNQTMAYYSSGSTITVERYLAQLIKQYPNSSFIPTAKYYLGRLFFNRYFYKAINKTDQYGQWEYLRSAHLVLNDIITNYSTDTITPIAQLQLGLCKQAMAKFGARYDVKMTDAVNTLKKAADNQPETDVNAKAKAQLMYCNYLFELGRNNKVSWDTVRMELSKVTTLYSIENKGYGARCSLMEAETYYWEYNYDKLIEYSQALIQTYPSSTTEVAWSKFWIGRANLRQGNYTTALNLYNEVLTKYQDNQGELFPPLIAISLYDKGFIYWRTKQPDTAKTLFQLIIQKYPNTKESKAAQILIDSLQSVLIEPPNITNEGVK